MSGWHFVRLAFCPVGILSYHPHRGSTMVTLIFLVLSKTLLETLSFSTLPRYMSHARVHFPYLLFFSDDGKGFNRQKECQPANSNIRNKKHCFDAGFNLLTHSNSHHKNGNTFITVEADEPSRPRPRCYAVPFWGQGEELARPLGFWAKNK